MYNNYEDAIGFDSGTDLYEGEIRKMMQTNIQTKPMANNEMNEIVRSSNFELLRIIAMAMIIGHL